MKQNSEYVLTAYTAAVNTLTLTEPDTDLIDLTDEQIDAAVEIERETSPMYQAACDLLESIKAEEPYFQQIAEENRIPLADTQDEKADKGLTTEINRSTTLVSVSDTVQSIAALLKRHPYGYKQGSRDRKGNIINEPFTAEENIAAEKWLASLKNGSPADASQKAN